MWGPICGSLRTAPRNSTSARPAPPDRTCRIPIRRTSPCRCRCARTAGPSSPQAALPTPAARRRPSWTTDRQSTRSGCALRRRCLARRRELGLIQPDEIHFRLPAPVRDTVPLPQIDLRQLDVALRSNSSRHARVVTGEKWTTSGAAESRPVAKEATTPPALAFGHEQSTSAQGRARARDEVQRAGRDRLRVRQFQELLFPRCRLREDGAGVSSPSNRLRP